jgi:hypothetical protein
VGLRVTADVSVVGFDDIQSAAFQSPALTTVKQPLRKMGKVAAEIVLRRISSPGSDSLPNVVKIAPELVVRASTAPPPASQAVGSFDSAAEKPAKSRISQKTSTSTCSNIVEAVMRETGLSEEVSTNVVRVVGRFLSGEPS